MKLNRILFIFVALITLSLVGCGGSSSNNPVSSGNANNGLITVRGNVSNLSGNGSVSFYTPTAATRNGMNAASTARFSITNDGVYRFNTDEKGDYSGTIPTGDYYIVAENSNGTMRAASSLKTLRLEQATGSNIELDPIKLEEVINVTGTLISVDNLSVENVPVYIANSPFVAFTDADGKFEFLSVPEGEYVFRTTIDSNIYRYTFAQTATITKTNTSVEVRDNTKETISGESFTGTVVDDNDAKLPNKAVTAVIETTGDIYFAITDSDGKFTMPFTLSADDSVSWFVDMQTVTMNNNKLTCTSASSGETVEPYGIKIIETVDDSGLFQKTNENTITLFDSNYNILSTDGFYFPPSFAINDIEPGTYRYMIESRNYKVDGSVNSYGYRFSDEISVTNTSMVNHTSNNPLAFINPRISQISIADNKYTVAATIEGPVNEIASYAIFAYAINTETLEFNNVSGNVTKPTKPVLRAATIPTMSYVQDLSLANLASGSYDIYTGFSIKFDGHNVATITLDPFQYAKH